MLTVKPMNAEQKLRRARTMLILGDGDEPFFGSVAVGLDLVPEKRCFTAATDGNELVYNPDWVENMNIEEAMALFEHEVYHVALKHASLMREIIKEPGFDNNLWQHACDIPIDNRLIEKGRKLPVCPNGHVHTYNKKYEGMSAIRIYRLMLEEKEKVGDSKCDGPSPGHEKTSSQDSGDGGMGGQVPKQEELLNETGGFGGILPLMNEDKTDLASDSVVKQFEKDFEQTISNASRILQKELESTIGDLPSFIQEIIEAHTVPQRTYRDMITDFLEEITRDDYCWAKPNIKYPGIYVPSLFEKELKSIAIIVDTSGSITTRELEIYASEISGILSEFEDLEIGVIFHNTSAYKTIVYSSSDLPIKFDKTQSGGTDYKDAYSKIQDLEDEPIVIFHFTDLDVHVGSYPIHEPEAKVFWMNTTPRRADGRLRYSTPPWGEVVDLELK